MNLRDVTAALALIEQSLVVVGCARDHACPIAVYLTGRRDAMLAAMLQAPTDPTDPTDRAPPLLSSAPPSVGPPRTPRPSSAPTIEISSVEAELADFLGDELASLHEACASGCGPASKPAALATLRRAPTERELPAVDTQRAAHDDQDRARAHAHGHDRDRAHDRTHDRAHDVHTRRTSPVAIVVDGRYSLGVS
jgi:hypothetical protein